MENSDPLNRFHPLIRQWFYAKYKEPTAIQAKAWPMIGEKRHLLITAPTGSGKTLTAFLTAINHFLTGEWKSGTLKVLYVSPLKALNNDIRVNLLEPLAELKALAGEEGFPQIRVLTRSGDTPQTERRKMIKTPPEILITTPETLNLLLNSKKARTILTGVSTLILDEIHAVAGGKRGTHLITAVERMTLLAGEFQRIAVSATVNPLEDMARFVGGLKASGDLKNPSYLRRDVTVIKDATVKKIDLKAVFPENAREELVESSWWPSVIKEVKKIIKRNNSTLIFTNTRRICEKTTRLINEDEPGKLAYAHHGSLSKEIRKVVEEKLKAGELKAIVATNSLELGIDIGALDEVVLIQTPPSMASAFQRIGRAGHRVGEVSRGIMIPLHGRDFLEAAVMAKCVLDGDIEKTLPIIAPLDILTQIVLAMAGVEDWDIDELYHFIKTAYPYKDLSRREFDLVLNMLEGRYGESKIRELKARVSIDRVDNRIFGGKGALPLIYMSGGTIPDRGYYELRVKDSNAKIGELDEEFVWERRVGNTFNLGTQNWKITKIDYQKVEVVPWKGPASYIPFWKADPVNSSYMFYKKVGDFLEKWDNRFETPEFRQELTEVHCFDKCAAAELTGFLRRQKKQSGAPLPHSRHLLIEHYNDLTSKSCNRMIILHTLWGGKINTPFSLALSMALEEKLGHAVEVFSDSLCVMLILPEDFDGSQIIDLLAAGRLEDLLKKKLEKTGIFGTKFRENAGRALLLPKYGFNTRIPLWLNRLRSKKLLDAVQDYKDFPIIIETWRTCIRQEFDLENLKRLLEDLRGGRIKYSEITTKQVSPFAGNIVFRQIDKHMYEGDTPTTGKTSPLGDEVFKELITSLDQPLEEALIEEFSLKLQCSSPGYAPRTGRELLDLLKERLFIPLPEWETLTAAILETNPAFFREYENELEGKLVSLLLPGARTRGAAALEQLPLLLVCLELSFHQISPGLLTGGELSEMESFTAKGVKKLKRSYQTGELSFKTFLYNWLLFYGPLSYEYLEEVIGIGKDLFFEKLEEDISDTPLVTGAFTGGESQICLRDNLDFLLRIRKKRRAPGFVPLPVTRLPLFLAAWQGNLLREEEGPEALQRILEGLFGYPAPVEIWEKEIFPSRLKGYRPDWLDRLFFESGLMWFGCGKQKIAFTLPGDLELFMETNEKNETGKLFPGNRGKYSFWDLKDFTEMKSGELTTMLWDLAWKGFASNDTFESLRSGMANKFKVPGNRQTASHRGRRGEYNRWKAARPLEGSWFLLPETSGEDLLYREEINRDRIRQLLDRYGILFKELMSHELKETSWWSLFKTLRRMELSGELIGGCFFDRLGGIQFVTPKGLALLQQELPDNRVFRINALDPLSLCGRKIPAFAERLPSRLPSNHLVYLGSEPVLVSRKNGSHVDIYLDPENEKLGEVLSLFTSFVDRLTDPLKAVKIESINGESSLSSPYKKALLDFGFIEDFKALTLRKRY